MALDPNVLVNLMGAISGRNRDGSGNGTGGGLFQKLKMMSQGNNFASASDVPGWHNNSPRPAFLNSSNPGQRVNPVTGMPADNTSMGASGATSTMTGAPNPTDNPMPNTPGTQPNLPWLNSATASPSSAMAGTSAGIASPMTAMSPTGAGPGVLSSIANSVGASAQPSASSGPGPNMLPVGDSSNMSGSFGGPTASPTASAMPPSMGMASGGMGVGMPGGMASGGMPQLPPGMNMGMLMRMLGGGA